jgi:pimeloyl-ACP methyl ester carboxylesterase
MTVEAHERIVKLGGTSVLVRELGAGPPILLINGIGGHTGTWGVLEQTLAGFRVLSFDAPGTGQSPDRCGITSVGELARLAVAVLDHFRVGQADVLGYSMGGIVLQQLCADFPGRVRRAAVVASTPGVGAVYGSPLAMLNVSTPLRYLTDDLYRRTIGALAGGRARTDRTWVAEHSAVRLRYRPSMRGYGKQAVALATWSGLPLLPHIHHPVLVVTGDDDPLTPVANSMMIAHLVPDARLLVIPDEGHLMLLDDRSTAHAPIRQFFEAETLAEAPVWQRARRVNEDDVRSALAGKGLQIQPWPWGPLGSYLRYRCVTRTLTPPSGTSTARS